MAQAGEATKQQGYSKQDYSLRCKYCSIGTDNCGANIGGLLSQHIVSCETPEGTVPVAKIARCINMGGFRSDNSTRPACEKIDEHYFKELPYMRILGITQRNIISCCEKSRGYVFTLQELKQGTINITESPTNKPEPIIKTPTVNKSWNESAEDTDIPF